MLDGIGSDDKAGVTLAESGHCLTVDREWERAAELTARFVDERV